MDLAHLYTEKQLEQIEKRFAKEYAQAEKEVAQKLKAYLDGFAKREVKMLEKVANGEISYQRYTQWRIGQVAVGERWKKLRDELAEAYTKVNVSNMDDIAGTLDLIFAESANRTMFSIEKGANVDTSFTLYDQNTVERLIADQPNLLPKPRVKIAKDKKWNQKKITSAVTQGILQGDSMGQIAKRMKGEISKGFSIEDVKNWQSKPIDKAVKELTRKINQSAIRNARTAVTGAENAGRLQGYKDAELDGINIKQQWVATLDNRTRHEHRELDGQIRKVDEPFEVDGDEIMYPADPNAEPHLVYNCRCTTIAVIDGHPIDLDVRDTSVIGDYEEWKHGKKKQEQPKVETAKFTPAKTVKEAEQYAKRFADVVTYKNVPVDKANIINEALFDLTQKYPIDKLHKIESSGRSNAVMRANHMELLINYRNIGKVLEESAQAFEKVQESTRETIELIKARYKGKMPRDMERKVEKLEKDLLFTRFGIEEIYGKDKLRAVVIHEYGHILSDQYFGMINEVLANSRYNHNPQMRQMRQRWKDALIKSIETGDIYKLSKYASTNDKEFFAECFMAREMGEKLPDYVEKLMREVLNNGIMR